MRVIAGEMKGRMLKAVPGKQTRPTGDKIKEAIFHKIGPFFAGGACLDLFAGSGSLGIEALSRGMDKAIFIDIMPEAVKTIRKNIELLNLQTRTEVYRNHANRALEILSTKGEKFKLIILDPPYDKVDYNQLLEAVIASNIMDDSCMIYCEHRPDYVLVYQKDMLEVIDEKTYNTTTAVTIFRKL